MPMPIRVTKFDAESVLGQAWHPTYADYLPTVHVLVGATVVASQVATPGESGPEFHLRLPQRYDAADLMILMGETREKALVRSPRVHSSRKLITVEEILATASTGPTLPGKCDIDAAASGLFFVEDIVGLLCFDILGRHPDRDLIREGVGSYHQESSYATFRRQLITSDEYAARAKNGLRPAGAVFSEPLVWGILPKSKRVPHFPEPERLDLTDPVYRDMEPSAFVSECNRIIYGGSLSQAVIEQHCALFAAGFSKTGYIAWLAAGSPPLPLTSPP